MLYIIGEIDLFGCQRTSKLLKLNEQGKDHASNQSSHENNMVQL